MRKRVIIVHKWDGSSEDDWRPWLRARLEKSGWEVEVPDMPDTKAPVIEKWVGRLAEIVGEPDEDTYFVGHSIGCQTILRYLQEVKTPIGGAVFVAGWLNLTGMENDKVKEIAKPWIETPIDFERVKKSLKHSTLILSDNDPYVSVKETSESFKSKLGSKIIIVSDAGHFTTEDGYSEMPIILDYLKKGNYAFIDSQNLNLGIRKIGWKLDYKKFRVYLREKYEVEKAYMFIGFVSLNQGLYDRLQESGFIIKFKPTIPDDEGKIKGNVDADLVLSSMIELNNYDKAVIVSSDGDFYSLVEYLQSLNKLETVLGPDKGECSGLLKQVAKGRINFMNNLRNKLEYKKEIHRLRTKP